MCLLPKSIGVFQNGGYATHVLVPHPRHLVDPGSLDPAVAATYACSGITVYSAIKKVMPQPPDEPIVLIGAGGLGLNAIARSTPKALETPQHRSGRHQRRKARRRRTRRRDHDRGRGRGGGAPSHHRRLWCAADRDHRPGERHGNRPVRVRRTAQRRQAGAGRSVRRRAFPAIAANGDPRAHHPGQLCRQSQGTSRKTRPASRSKATCSRCRSPRCRKNQANDALMRLRDGKVTGRLVLKAEAA